MSESPEAHLASITHENDFSHEEFLGLVAGIANHEAKLAVTAVVASQPDQWFGESSLWNEIKNRQGAQVGWVPDRKGPIKYCINSLGPVGLVVKGTIAGERGAVTAFTANDDEPRLVQRALALSGALLDWSYKNPTISLQKIFGVTASKGAFRTPIVRYGVIKTLAASSTESFTYNQVAQNITGDEIDEYNVYSSIRELRDAQFLETEIIDTAEHVTLEITAPYNYRGAGLHFDQLSESAQLAHSALDALWSAGKKIINFKDFCDTAISINPRADLVKLRDQWQFGVNQNGENMPNLKVAERKMDMQSSVRINSEHADAIVDLIGRLNDIDTGTGLDTYIETALNIIGNPTIMAALFMKAKNFSANVSGQDNGTEMMQNQILRIVAKADKITARGVFKALEASDRKLTVSRVRTYLGMLAKSGALQQEKLQIDPSKSRLYNFYSVSSPGND